MSVATLVLTQVTKKDIPFFEGDIFGVDFGAAFCIEHNILMKGALGDFDSIDSNQLNMIYKLCSRVTKLNPIKDESDFEASLKLVIDYDRIVVVGGLGGRFDHAYVNIQHCIMDTRLEFVDEQNRIKCYSPGKYRINKYQFKYCSFFMINQGNLTLRGFKYPLENRQLTKNDLFTLSNEILGDQGEIEISQGDCLVIQSKDTKKESSND